MKKKSNRIQFLKNFIDNKTYFFNDSIYILKKFGTLDFIESIEAHISLNINPKYSDQQLKTNFILPNKIKNNIKIAVFTEMENKNSYLDVDVIFLGLENLIEKID